VADKDFYKRRFLSLIQQAQDDIQLPRGQFIQLMEEISDHAIDIFNEQQAELEDEIDENEENED
jgi:hypothetical protein